jgi:hypothetical protein
MMIVTKKWNWCVLNKEDTGCFALLLPLLQNSIQVLINKRGIILIIETDFSRNNPLITVYKLTGSFFILCFLKPNINMMRRTWVAASDASRFSVVTFKVYEAAKNEFVVVWHAVLWRSVERCLLPPLSEQNHILPRTWEQAVPPNLSLMYRTTRSHIPDNCIPSIQEFILQ